VSELRGGNVETYVIDAAEFGFGKRGIPRVSSADESAAIATGVLEGKEGAARDVCLLNAGAAIYVGGKAGSIMEGIGMAGRAVDSGKALAKLREAAAFG
jgi:anthranilate phosphoribosyltransferase